MNEIIGIDVDADLDALPLGDMDLSEFAILHKAGKLWKSPLSDLFLFGSWAPTIIGATTAGTQTYDDQTGHFVKIGPLVHIQGRVSITAKDAAMAGNARIGELPYPVRIVSGSTPRGAIALSQFSGVTLSGQLGLDLVESATYMRIYINSLSGGAPVSLGVSAIAEATSFVFGGTYITD